MKLTFGPKDSIYKIFKLLKKIPRGKQVDIFLDSHPLLEDIWRIDTFVKHIRELDIVITVTTKSALIMDHLIKYGITVMYIGEKKRYEQALQRTKKIFGSSTPLLSPIEYIKSKLALIAELLVLAIIVYLFRGTISPKATIHIYPTTTIQPITYGFLVYPHGAKPELTTTPLGFPWYTGAVQTSISKTIDLQSFTTQLVPARGKVRFYNTRQEELSLLANTILITKKNITYTVDTWIKIPPGTTDAPGTADATITAKDYLEDGTPIGEEGNIDTKTQLLIQKLPESIDEKTVWAYPINDITNGETILSGTVVSTDIQNLEKKLLDDIKQQLEGIIRSGNKEKNHLPIPLPDEIDIKITRFVTNAQPGESASFLQGTIDCAISYPYIKKSDIAKESRLYMQQRSTTQIQKGGISLERVDFYSPRALGSGAYSIPTTIQTYGSYDFSSDPYAISQKIKQMIAGRTIKEAKSLILLFDEVHDIKVSIAPFRYSSIPKSTTNIVLHIEENKNPLQEGYEEPVSP